MRVTIDQDRCKGHGQCVAVAPEVFVMGDDERGHSVNESVDDDQREQVEDAILMCPEAAIAWVMDGD